VLFVIIFGKLSFPAVRLLAANIAVIIEQQKINALQLAAGFAVLIGFCQKPFVRTF